jgi:anti-sigma-K factor RskA
MRMRQSLAQFEEAFHATAAEEVRRRERLRRQAAERARTRRHVRVQRTGTMRFVLLVAAILATTVIVTVVMFQTLTLLIGG